MTYYIYKKDIAFALSHTIHFLFTSESRKNIIKMKNITLYFNEFQSNVQIVNSYQELVRLIDNEQMTHIKVN